MSTHLYTRHIDTSQYRYIIIYLYQYISISIYRYIDLTVYNDKLKTCKRWHKHRNKKYEHNSKLSKMLLATAFHHHVRSDHSLHTMLAILEVILLHGVHVDVVRSVDSVATIRELFYKLVHHWSFGRSASFVVGLLDGFRKGLHVFVPSVQLVPVASLNRSLVLGIGLQQAHCDVSHCCFWSWLFQHFWRPWRLLLNRLYHFLWGHCYKNDCPSLQDGSLQT